MGESEKEQFRKGQINDYSGKNKSGKGQVWIGQIWKKTIQKRKHRQNQIYEQKHN